jgi:hypothetical protein
MFQKLKKNEYFCIFLSLSIYLFCRFLRNVVFWTPTSFSPKRVLQHWFKLLSFKGYLQEKGSPDIDLEGSQDPTHSEE